MAAAAAAAAAMHWARGRRQEQRVRGTPHGERSRLLTRPCGQNCHNSRASCGPGARCVCAQRGVLPLWFFCCGSATSSLYASLCVCALFVCMSVCLCLCLLHGLCLRSACMKLACPICIKSWGACSAFGAAGARCVVVARWQPPARAVVRRCAAAADGQRWRLGGQPPPRRVACGGRAAGRDAAPARRGGGGRAGRVRGGGAPAVGARGRECSTAGGAAGGTRVSSRWRWRGSASGRRRLGAASARRHYSARTRPCRRHWHRRNAAAAAAAAVTRCWRWGRTCG